ncbi:RNA polymerase sigma factor [Candidatus Hydrogenedentota bacterium]
MPRDDELETLSDCQLMLRVSRGDRASFRVLYVRHAVAATRFFYSLSGRHVEAEDLCQEVFMRIWRIRDRYCITGAFKSYFYAIARLIWMERLKKLKRCNESNATDVWKDMDGMTAEPCSRPNPRAESVTGEVRERIMAAMRKLPEEQRVVFALRSVGGLSLGDIAKVLDCPVNTVRSRKILAMKKLRAMLKDFMFVL